MLGLGNLDCIAECRNHANVAAIKLIADGNRHTIGKSTQRDSCAGHSPVLRAFAQSAAPPIVPRTVCPLLMTRTRNRVRSSLASSWMTCGERSRLALVRSSPRTSHGHRPLAHSLARLVITYSIVRKF